MNQIGKRLIKILSIDGGGVRGIIPANVLANLESRLPAGVKIAKCFDIIAGTSIGGIIALMLNVPDETKNPLYIAKYIADEMVNLSKDVFSRSLWQVIKSGAGSWGPKYDCDILYSYLGKYMQGKSLKSTITNVLIPSYDIASNKPVLFSNVDSSKFLGLNPLSFVGMSYAACATSAAPTYFAPFMSYIDGGVAINNPAMIAAEFAKDIYGPDIEVMILSLGTGTIFGSGMPKLNMDNVDSWGLVDWAENIISILLSSETSMVHHELKNSFDSSIKYYRMQPIVKPANFNIDDISNSNIIALQDYAQDLIRRHDNDLDEIARRIYK